MVQFMLLLLPRSDPRSLLGVTVPALPRFEAPSRRRPEGNLRAVRPANAAVPRLGLRGEFW